MAEKDPENPSPVPPAPEPPPPPSPPESVAKSRYDEALARIHHLEETLRVTSQPPVQPQQLPAPGGDPVSAIAQRLGWTPEQVREHAPVFETFFQAMATPYVNALANLADQNQLLTARQSLPDFSKYEPEIEAERRSRIAQGQYLSPQDAYHLIKSRKLKDILEEERQKFTTEQAGARTQVGQTADDLGPGAQSPKPQSRAPLTREEFARLPLEEKEKLLEGVTF